MFNKIKNIWSDVKGSLIPEVVDPTPKAKIGYLEYKTGKLQETIESSTADYALYSKKDLEEFVRKSEATIRPFPEPEILQFNYTANKLTMELRKNELADLKYAKEVLGGFEKTKAPAADPRNLDYG